jgi:hypothetical protein
MPLVNFTSLDFDQIKTSIKDYLRSNSNFTDYDFEGSNLSVLIDVLAYNTFITSYNANMIANEVFIDSATLRENVVSLAKNIGYTPRSRKASRANISFTVDTTGLTYSPVTLTIKRGLFCTSTSDFLGTSYAFIIPEDVTVKVDSNGLASFENIGIYEGTYVTQNFTANSFNPDQRFILDNAGIDTSLISVYVRNSELSSTSKRFRISDSIFNIDSQSEIFFVNEIEDERYELIFGDGVFGKKLEEPNYIEVAYSICNGEETNGISQFVFSGRILDNNGRVISSGISVITTNVPSYGGANIESVPSIKKYAPRIYASQNRAVTSNDYEALIPRIYAETESVSVFGGEELTPPQYGKVFISVKPENGEYLSGTIKDNIRRELKRYSVAGIVPEIIDLKYLYLESNINAYYNSNKVSGPDYVKTLIYSNLERYSNSPELNKFGARFKYSKFLKIVDDTHESVTSNITNIVMRRDMRPVLNSFAEYEICFGNRFHIQKTSGYNVKSSGFQVSGISGTVYMSDAPNADGLTGRIFLFRLISASQPEIVRNSVGTIDYIKGEIRLNPINIISTLKTKTVPIIEISISPYSNDVIGLQDLYLQLDINNSTINMIIDQISSGSDTSGTNYIVSSSYTNGSLVR